MKRRLFLTASLAAFAIPARAQDAPTKAVPAARPEAGKVDLIEGDVRILNGNRQMRRPQVGDTIYEGESIVTGKDGELHLNMDDGGYVAVRPDTRMRIAMFKAEGGPDDRSVFGLLSGSFRSVTGWIGKLGGNHYRINTPTATIGVRGTDHEPLVIPEGGTAGEPGTYDRVHAGETRLQTPQGAVNVKANQAGFTPRQGGVQPRVLAQIPAAFRPTRHEDRLEGLHDRLQQQIGQRQEQRRRGVEQRRVAAGKPAGKNEPARQEEKKERKARQAQRPRPQHKSP